MRRTLLAAGLSGLLAAAGALAAQDLTGIADSNAREVLKRSRTAVGGVEAVARIESILFTGLSRIQTNQGLVECEVEIRMLLPDSYLRIDRASFGEKRAGVQGGTVLSAVIERGRTTLPPDALKPEILRTERERMVQLLLGAAAYVPPRVGVRFRTVPGPVSTYQAQATSESGAQRAAVRAGDGAGAQPGAVPRSGGQTYASNAPDQYSIDVSARDGAWFRFTADHDTFAPARLSYVNANGDPVVVTFNERRETDGVKVPYRITTTSRGRIIDDLLLDRVAINSGVSKADFGR
jgi:hypothetical protein